MVCLLAEGKLSLITGQVLDFLGHTQTASISLSVNDLSSFSGMQPKFFGPSLKQVQCIFLSTDLG